MCRQCAHDVQNHFYCKIYCKDLETEREMFVHHSDLGFHAKAEKKKKKETPLSTL